MLQVGVYSSSLSFGAKSADARTLDAVELIGLDVLAVSVILVEPKAVLVDVSLEVPKRLLAVGIGFVDLDVSWLVEAAAFKPNAPLGVEEDVPNAEKPNALCEGPLSVEVAASPKVGLPKAGPVVVEDVAT